MAGIFDPKFIKDGNVTANLSFLATIKLPSLTSESSSLDFLSIAADNSIKKRSLGTMALLSAANFYDKTTADSTFLKLTGGIMSGTLTVNAQVNVGSTLAITGSDLTIRNAARGAGGRALVHDGTNGLTVNYGDDFTGGVRIGSNVFFSNTASSYLLNVNFGIGTATPSEKVSVLGNISMTGMFKLNASFGTTGQFIKNTGTLSEWVNITPADIAGLYLGTKLLMEDTRTSFGNGIYSYRTYNGQTTNNPTGLFFGQILNWGGGTTGGQAQLAVGWTPSDNNYIAFRSLRDTIDNWYSWKRLFHEGYKPTTNDITGLATYNGLTNYLPLSGGSITGTLSVSGNLTLGNTAIFSNNKFIYWNDTLGNPKRLLGLGSNGFHVGDVDNTIANSVTNLWANVQHNFFVNSDLKVQLSNGWNYFKGHIQAYGVLNPQVRTQSSDSIVGKIQSIDGNSVAVGAESNHYLTFITNNINRVTIDTAGYFGIGTSQPQTKLHVGGGYGQLNGLAIGSLAANEYGTLLFTENYGNGVTHLFSLKQTVGYGDLALAEYGGRVGIGTDRPNVKLDVRGTIRIGNNGFVTGSAGSFMDIWHASSTGNSQVNLQAWSNGGNTYDSIVLQPLSGEVRIGMPTDSYYKLNVGGTAKIDGFLRLGENLAFNCNQFAYWKDSAGTDRRIVGMNAVHSIYLGDIDRTISNSNLILLANSTHWFYVGQENIAVITSSGLDVKGNYYQNGVLKTFFSGNYNDLVNRPDLSAYLTQANVVTDNANVTVNNLSPISSKLVYLYINDLWGAVNSKATANHTHDYYSLTNRPTLFDGNYNSLSNRPDFGSFLTWGNVVTDLTNNWNDTNNNPLATKLVKAIADGKSNNGHTHDYYNLTNRPSLFDGNYNNLSYRPDLSAYLTQANVVTDNANVNVNNLSPISSKLVYLYVNDLWGAVNSKAAANHIHDYYSLTNRPTLFSGSYTDLSNKPVLFDGNYNNLSNKPTLFDGNYNSLINKPTLFDGSYNSLSNLPNLNNFALAANTIPVTPYSGASSNPVSGLSTTENVRFWSTVRINTLFVSSSAYLEDSLSVAGYIWCDGGIRGTSLALSNPTTLLDYQVTKTNVEGVYVKVGNNVVKLTLTQFKNLMATV